MINLELNLVRSFVAIAEVKSFTRAGERLGRSQSAISLQIRRLEDQIGLRLLSRDPRHVVLTPEGETFLPQARRLLRLNDEILSGLSGGDVSGEVRLGAPEDFATVHLPDILGEFIRANPKATLGRDLRSDAQPAGTATRRRAGFGAGETRAAGPGRRHARLA